MLVVPCRIFHRLSSLLILFFSKATTKGTVEGPQKLQPLLGFTTRSSQSAGYLNLPLVSSLKSIFTLLRGFLSGCDVVRALLREENYIWL